MNQFLLLLPFAASVPVSLISRKSGYSLLILSSILLAAYAIASGISTLALFYVISAISLALASWYSIAYDMRNKWKWLAPLFSTAAFGIALILLSTNSLEFLAGWEVMSIAGYLMIGLNKKDASSAFTFLAFSELSTVFLIVGMAYAYTLTGTIAFVAITSAIPLALMSIGFFVKMGILPFMISEWEPQAVRSSPANSAAMFSGLMTLMGAYGLVKIALLSPSSIPLGVALMAIGAFSVVFAALFEYVSENAKIMLGYSTIENNGAILVAIGLMVAGLPGLAAGFVISTVVLLCLAHSLAKTGLFLMGGSLDSDDLAHSSSINDRSYLLGSVLLSSSLSGLLPTIGGVAVWMLLESLFMTASVSNAWLSVPAIAIGSVVALGEGIVSGAMVKFISFAQLSRKQRRGKAINSAPIISSGLLTILFGIAAVYLLSNKFVTGNVAVGIPDGFLISSITDSGATFGVVSPLFVAMLICIFLAISLLVFRKPKTRHAPVWNNGIEGMPGYTSFAFANNIRIMVGRVFRTNPNSQLREEATQNVFWNLIVGVSICYRNIARRITWKFMNSSISWYLVYILAAFLFAMIFVAVA